LIELTVDHNQLTGAVPSNHEFSNIVGMYGTE
jgi:hypothetical protein